MKRIAIASHVALIDGKEYDGIGNVLIESLTDIPADFYMVRHSMEGGLGSLVRKYVGQHVSTEQRLPVLRKPSPARYVTEFIATCLYFTFRKKVDVYVGIDPLNALAAVVLKKCRRIDTCIFYTPDYSVVRFENGLLNRLYHAIDRYCVRHADEVWCVSTKIQKVRSTMGLRDDKNILLPNVPPTKFAHLQDNKHDKYALITYGIVDKQLDYEGSIKAVAALSKKYPKLNMVIVGNGPEEANLKALVTSLGLENKVSFKGRRPLSETLEFASRAGIGLALYTGAWAFNVYGDSTKCREYFYFGLPVISTDSHSTVQEIKDSKAGLIVGKSVESYVKAIESILEHYDTYADASKKLGQKYAGIHKKEISRILKTSN